MKYLTISLIYWAINISAVICVGIQHDPTARQQAEWWLIYATGIYVIAVIGTIISIKLKK
jgi:hypothetical protein